MRDDLWPLESGGAPGRIGHVSVDTMREEALRQLHLMAQLLQDVQQQGLIGARHSSVARRATLDSQSLAETLEVLAVERRKLEKLEMVLAVVGPMKAGKSTTINAIVGAEVLPNRNRAMTILPTLIRHTPGVSRPQLKLFHTRSLNKLLPVLRRALQRGGAAKVERAEALEDADQLLDRVRQDVPFTDRYEGEEEIFAVLKQLNDFVRLCVELDVEFPFEKYAQPDGMPTIEVEFVHLKKLPPTRGSFALLDTPGPNEAGQPHLRRLLADQLRKASAVLAVLDYTQLETEADAAVREHLLGIAETTASRLHVLVNKFETDRNSDDEAWTRRYVAQQLLRAVISAESVYPVSATRAFLASRARNALERGGRLDFGQAWVPDFMNLAFGVSWDAGSPPDEAQMARACMGVWRLSGFERPLTEVIDVAYRNTACEALRSATSKLDRIARDTGDFLKAHMGASKRSTKQLEQSIDALERDIEVIVEIAQRTHGLLNQSLSDTQKGLDAAAIEMEHKLVGILEEFFTNDDRIPTERVRGRDTRAARRDTLMEFDDATQAKEFLLEMERSIRQVMQDSERAFKACIEEGIDRFSLDLDRHRVEAMEAVVRSVQQSIDGFDIVIPLPRVESIVIELPIAELLGQAINEKTKVVTRKRRKSGVWGTICSWFNTDDWGWESYEVQKGYVEVDLQRIKKSSLKGARLLASSARHALEETIHPQLRNVIRDFYGAYQEKVGHVRGDLLSAIDSHKGHRDMQVQALGACEKLARYVADLETDCADLLSMVRAYGTAAAQTDAAAEVSA